MTVEEIQAHIDHINGLLLNISNQSYSISPSDGGTGRSVSHLNRTELLNELAMWQRTLAKAKGNCALPACVGAFNR